MKFLVFQLQAPLASWGYTAVGEFRGSQDAPGESALIGLLGAALGLRRDDEAAHTTLRDGYGYAVGVQSVGALLRDYHTVQVPRQAALKGRPHATRREELAVPKSDLHTILSSRDYRQDAGSLVAVQAREAAPYALEALAGALRRPRYVLYLGRKACPPSAPLFPQVIESASAHEAFEAYLARLNARIGEQKDARGRPLLEPAPKVRRMAWGDHVEAGVKADLTMPRKDWMIRRRGWQFRDRTEHLALLEGE